MVEEVSVTSLADLLTFLSLFHTPHRPASSDHAVTVIEGIVRDLFKRDYDIGVISNRDGELCTTYPPELLVIERSKRGGPKVNETNVVYKAVVPASTSRVHGRFVFPVILVRGKNICRSGTISNRGETALNFVNGKARQLISSFVPVKAPHPDAVSLSIDQARANDVALLSVLRVGHIMDLMVEQRKKKYMLHVCSSEKVDTEGRYSQFKIAATPYPGCEFFKDYADNGHIAAGLKYDWTAPLNDAILSVDNFYLDLVDKAWPEYRTWDLARLTCFYMKLLLAMLADTPAGTDPGGILIHCISGWDRTPTFVSILRLILWAEREVHESLTAEEILYLTLGYDWLLFQHHLGERRSKGEDIFHFAFHALEFMHGREYSLRHWTKEVALARARAASTPHPVAVNSSAHSSTAVATSSLSTSTSAPSTVETVPFASGPCATEALEKASSSAAPPSASSAASSPGARIPSKVEASAADDGKLVEKDKEKVAVVGFALPARSASERDPDEGSSRGAGPSPVIGVVSEEEIQASASLSASGCGSASARSANSPLSNNLAASSDNATAPMTPQCTAEGELPTVAPPEPASSGAAAAPKPQELKPSSAETTPTLSVETTPKLSALSALLKSGSATPPAQESSGSSAGTLDPLSATKKSPGATNPSGTTNAVSGVGADAGPSVPASSAPADDDLVAGLTEALSTTLTHPLSVPGARKSRDEEPEEEEEGSWKKRSRRFSSYVDVGLERGDKSASGSSVGGSWQDITAAAAMAKGCKSAPELPRSETPLASGSGCHSLTVDPMEAVRDGLLDGSGDCGGDGSGLFCGNDKDEFSFGGAVGLGREQEYEAEVEVERIARLMLVRKIFFSLYHSSVIVASAQIKEGSTAGQGAAVASAVMPSLALPATPVSSTASEEGFWSWIPGFGSAASPKPAAST